MSSCQKSYNEFYKVCFIEKLKRRKKKFTRDCKRSLGGKVRQWSRFSMDLMNWSHKTRWNSWGFQIISILGAILEKVRRNAVARGEGQKSIILLHTIFEWPLPYT